MKLDIHKLENAAQVLLGHSVQWRVHGRDFAGMDCMGVLLWLYGEAGVCLPDPMSRDTATVLKSDLAALFTRIVTPQYGCVAVYADTAQRPIAHLGVLFGDQVVHAVEDRGVIATPWRKLRPTAFYRLHA